MKLSVLVTTVNIILSLAPLPWSLPSSSATCMPKTKEIFYQCTRVSVYSSIEEVKNKPESWYGYSIPGHTVSVMSFDEFKR